MSTIATAWAELGTLKNVIIITVQVKSDKRDYFSPFKVCIGGGGAQTTHAECVNKTFHLYTPI